jgi:ferredoxin
MGHRVEVDKDICISAGKCVGDFPAAFHFDEDELAEATDGAGALSRDDLLAAMRNCPSGAIKAFEDDGTEIDPFA